MNGKFHRIFSIITLLFFLILFHSFLAPIMIAQITLGWFAQTLRYNNDLDHPKYRKNKGVIKYLLFFTKHRGIMHTNLFWVIICIPLILLGFQWVAVGVIGSAITHNVVDRVSTPIKRKIGKVKRKLHSITG